jgi:hypothetical protein
MGILMGTSSINDQFFIAMFDYQMVSHFDLPKNISKFQDTRQHHVWDPHLLLKHVFVLSRFGVQLWHVEN